MTRTIEKTEKRLNQWISLPKITGKTEQQQYQYREIKYIPRQTTKLINLIYGRACSVCGVQLSEKHLTNHHGIIVNITYTLKSYQKRDERREISQELDNLTT